MTDASPPGSRPRVFIAHSREDSSAAALIGRSLHHDFEVALSTPQIMRGRPTLAIRDAIEASDVVVVLISGAIRTSEWVAFELLITLDRESKSRDIDLVPVLLEPCELPDSLQGRLAVDLSSDGALGVTRLVTRLRRDRAVDFKILDSATFEGLVFDVLQREFGSLRKEPLSPDLGYDFTGSRNGETWYVQAKHYSQRRVSVSTIHRAVEIIESQPSTRALLVTSGQLTSVAEEYLTQASRPSVRIDVIDGVELKQLLAKYPDLIDRYFGQEATGNLGRDDF